MSSSPDTIPAEDERPRGRPIRVRPVSGIRRFDSRITEKIPFLLDIRCKASPQAILDKERRILTAVQAKKSPISRPLSALDGVSGRAKTSSVETVSTLPADIPSLDEGIVRRSLSSMERQILHGHPVLAWCVCVCVCACVCVCVCVCVCE